MNAVLSRQYGARRLWYLHFYAPSSLDMSITFGYKLPTRQTARSMFIAQII